MPQEHIAVDRAGTVGLPLVKILTGRGFVTGKSGSGKSNSVNVIVEETLDLGRPLLIIDTDGEYWGLKEQYRMLHLGNDERCDAKISAADADTIVEVALEEGVPTILDISGFLREEDADEVVHRVVKQLFQAEKRKREPFMLIAEEVHEYLPQQGGLTEAGETLIQVAKRGRKHGLGFIGVSQRPASVDKDFITQCDWITWHRLTWQNDTEVVRSILGSDAADEVEGLDPGEAIMMTDWDEQVQQVQFRKKRTFDAGQTPGFEEFNPPDLLPVSPEILRRFGVESDADVPDREEDTEDGFGSRQREDGDEASAESDGADTGEAPDEGSGEASEGDGGDAEELESAPADAEAEASAGTGQESEDGASGQELAEVAPDDGGGDVATPGDEARPRDPGEPAVVDAEPVVAESDGGSTLEGPGDGSGRDRRSGRATPTAASRRRQRAGQPDRPVVVEFGELVIYVARRTGGAIAGTVGRVTGAVRAGVNRLLGRSG